MQTISSSLAAAGSMATVSGGASLPSRRVNEKAFVSGTAVLSTTTRTQKKLSLSGNNKSKVVSASNESSPNVDYARVASSAPGVLGTSFTMLLSNVGAVEALTKEDVDEAYVKVEQFSTQVTTTAGTIFETAKSVYDKVFTTVKPGLDVAAPIVQQTTDTVTKFAGPLASDLAEEAQKALKSAGLDTEPGVEFAKSAVEQTSKGFAMDDEVPKAKKFVATKYSSGSDQERRPFNNPNASGGLFDAYSFGSRSATSTRTHSYKLRVVRPRASAGDGVETSEASASEETRASTSNSDPPTIESIPSSSNPFASGKISKIAAKQAGDSKNSVSASIAQKAATPLKKPAVAKPPAVGQLSANAAAQLNVSRNPSVFTVPTKPTEGKPTSPFTKPTDGKPTSPFTQAGSSKPTAPTNPFRKTPIVPADWEKAGARPAGSGKRVLEAFKEGEEGKTTKFGQPVVPTNIFDEVRRTPEEIAADAFKFEISSGQLILAASFVVVIAIMFGTVFLVWKVGAIHYNEY